MCPTPMFFNAGGETIRKDDRRDGKGRDGMGREGMGREGKNSPPKVGEIM